MTQLNRGSSEVAPSASALPEPRPPGPALATSREGAAAVGAGVSAARAAMVARLEESGDLRAGPVRDALLALPGRC
ncbi:hypothetical protein AB0M39_01825 [Streptomyces sp. NPDC051907]|uniref:hypothetical protein n=1 Tax=Streptomyces sp. NPDC051907 TaxID=3155284 RepID=UPI00341EA203